MATGRRRCEGELLGGCRGRYFAHFFHRRQLRRVPAAAERFDQLHAGGHLLPAQIHRRLLVASAVWFAP